MSVINKILVAFCFVVLQVAATPACFEWVLGYSSESCTESCAKISKTCTLSALQAVTTAGAFEAAITGAKQLGKTETVSDSNSFCTGGVNSWAFATAPAAMQYPLYVKEEDSAAGHYVMMNSCYYPENGVTGDCDTQYSVPPVQRFCPCDSATC
jgi:hypothetical protein